MLVARAGPRDRGPARGLDVNVGAGRRAAGRGRRRQRPWSCKAPPVDTTAPAADRKAAPIRLGVPGSAGPARPLHRGHRRDAPIRQRAGGGAARVGEERVARGAVQCAQVQRVHQQVDCAGDRQHERRHAPHLAHAAVAGRQQEGGTGVQGQGVRDGQRAVEGGGQRAVDRSRSGDRIGVPAGQRGQAGPAVDRDQRRRSGGATSAPLPLRARVP